MKKSATTTAMIGVAALALAGCSKTYTVWEVVDDEKGHRGAVVEAGLDRTACELVRARHAKEIQAAFGSDWATVNGAFKVYGDGTKLTVESVCLVAGKKP
jgi:hypothetical protein